MRSAHLHALLNRSLACMAGLVLVLPLHAQQAGYGDGNGQTIKDKKAFAELVEVAKKKQECPYGVCAPAPSCEELGLSKKDCKQYKNQSRARGRMRDNNGLEKPGYGQRHIANNTEQLLPNERFTLWTQDENLFTPEASEEVVYEQRIIRNVETIKLTDRVDPIRFASGGSEIPEEFIEKLRNVLAEMQGRENVRLNFIGHTDNEALSSESRARFGDNVGLSEARAQMVAEYFQRALDLQPEAVSFEGRGASQPLVSNNTVGGRQRNRRVEVEVWYDEVTEQRQEEAIAVKPASMTRIKVCRVMERCIYKRLVGNYKKVQLSNAVPPIRYEGTRVNVGASELQKIAMALAEVQGMPNVSVRVVGHTDNQPLSGAVERIYGDNLSLSKALAGQAARKIQEHFRFRSSAVSAVGKGETEPVDSNTTASGRALNRRIEVQIWHDDPRGSDISEPQACPGGSQAEMVSVIHQDDKPLVPFKNGQPAYPNGFIKRIKRILGQLSDKANLRIHFVGHTTNERLSRRAAMVYSDHQGLSEARAKRVMNYVQDSLVLDSEQVSFEGRGFVDPLNKPDDSPFARKAFNRFGEADQRIVNPADARVELEIVYDEVASIVEDPNLEIIRVQQEEQPVSPFSLHPIRISVDGETLDDSRRHAADVQRCTDVALDSVDVQLRYDSLQLQPRLNVQAVPATITFWDDPATEPMESKVSFAAYSNYRHFFNRAEVRVFNKEQSLQDEPLAIVPLSEDLVGEWWTIPEIDSFEGPVKELRYLLRVYDSQGRFDETAAKPLWVVNQLKSPEILEDLDLASERLVIYGENHLRTQNIPLKGGTITAYGKQLPEDYSVWVMNQAVPATAAGEFITEQIIPDGLHSVEVAILDQQGNGSLYLRDLELKRSDWFIVGIADLTMGIDDTEGPAALVTADDKFYNSEFWLDGQLSFYTKGKLKNGVTLTSSVDRTEGLSENILNNANDKGPQALFRRLDPDDFYPTFGDDSTTLEDAPTSGRFYIKAEKDKWYGLWGNFETKLYDTDLTQIDRALYGANGHFESRATTRYGESRTEADLFVAEPGTLLSREEFRGTGGSLYFLQRRDLTQGSERLRIEVRDKDSDIVLQSRNLIYAQDYDIDYLQGRILLNEPLPSTADDGFLVQNGSLGGNPIYLVARYEYTPGFDDIDDVASGGRVARWFNDNVKAGVTFSNQEQLGEVQELSGLDLTLRKTPNTYVKLESASSEGPAFGQSFSNDGGFQFNNFESNQANNNQDDSAAAYRVEAAAELSDLFKNAPGKVTLYVQEREAGFSAPGQLTNTEISQAGATVDMPLSSKVQLRAKLDDRSQDQGVSTSNIEVDTIYRISDHWRFSGGVRHDDREDSSVQVPLTQTQGSRTDVAVEGAYDSLGAWSAYSYLQGTASSTETREDNNRFGVGGAYQINDRLKLDGEVSNGDGGSGAKLGIDYLVTDRTNLYMAYLIETERSDTGLRGRNGRAAAGFRTRYSDSLSVYGEERLLFGDQPAGLTHAYGVDIAPADRWTLGLSVEAGTLEDNRTAEETERLAYGFSAGFSGDRLQYSGAMEFREDTQETVERTTTLLRNNFSFKLSSSWRFVGKLNILESESTQGEFYDGDYTEAVLGYAYRPVFNDKLNMLFKYTFFENLPAADQLSTNNGSSSDFIQRSNIYSFDAMYDISKRWSLGGKVARRVGEVALERTDPQFFESNANLYVLRADWHVVRLWDLLIEARTLEVEEAQDKRTGMLAAAYRHLGDNLKVGVGYNFTDFSDDLTDLDFDSQGLFINVVGKL